MAAEAVKNATSAGRSATLLAPAPNQRVTGVAEITVAVAAAMVVETMALSGVEARKLGVVDHPNFWYRVSHDLAYSYSCGGVGHLSRDCVQGSKCYNCSGFVRVYRRP